MTHGGGLAGVIICIEKHTQCRGNEKNTERYFGVDCLVFSFTVLLDLNAHYEKTVIFHQGYENSQFTQQKSMLH